MMICPDTAISAESQMPPLPPFDNMTKIRRIIAFTLSGIGIALAGWLGFQLGGVPIMILFAPLGAFGGLILVVKMRFRKSVFAAWAILTVCLIEHLSPPSPESVQPDREAKAYRCVAIAAMQLAKDEMKTPELIVEQAMGVCKSDVSIASEGVQDEIEEDSGGPIEKERAEYIYRFDLESEVRASVEQARADTKIGVPDVYTDTAKAIAEGKPHL